MSATFEIYKYTGKDNTFGTPVTSIGIKRIDGAVPAVYQQVSGGVGNVIPSDDTSDVNTYCIYRPDDENDTTYSFESIFKLILKTPPSNQLSHVRIYPNTTQPNDINIPMLYIGNSRSYNRPTNSASLVAVNNIWNYSRTSPFLLTVGGNYGQYVNEQLPITNYNITVHDIGFGNVIYLNEERQIDVPILPNKSYQFIDRTNGLTVFTVYDPNTNQPVVHQDIIITTVNGNRVVTINTTSSLLSTCPNGLLYGDVTDVSRGYTMTWIDIQASPVLTEEYTVEVKQLANGTRAYYLNGIKNPTLNFMENKRYRFINLSGDTDPLRFLNNNASMIANSEREIVIYGVTITNGGTVNEIIEIDPSKVRMANTIILGYQSVMHACYGNKITNINTALVGNYNINTVGAGVINPMGAGETDYVFLQLRVTGNSTVGQTIPELIIEYDES